MTETTTIVPEQDERKAERPARESLWVNDAELIRRMGVPEKIARHRIRALDEDKRSGFPRKQEFWGNRRYWPAVRAYLDKVYGDNMAAPQQRRLP